MLLSISYSIYLYVIAMALALLEIQIEGPYGWAEKLPCWRTRPDSFLAKIFGKLMNGKLLTGYHISINSFMVIILHLPFFVGIHWTLIKELELFSAYFLLTVFWDFLWFVWNPSYGLKRFKPQYIWWHKKWTWVVPKDYPSGIIVSSIFALIAASMGGINIFFQWSLMLGIFIALTVLNCLVL